MKIIVKRGARHVCVWPVVGAVGIIQCITADTLAPQAFGEHGVFTNVLMSPLLVNPLIYAQYSVSERRVLYFHGDVWRMGTLA
jgi:hypothetical protein